MHREIAAVHSLLAAMKESRRLATTSPLPDILSGAAFGADLPHSMALMTQAAHPKPKSRALDVIGTGSGYQAAVLAESCQEVYTVEILKPLAESAQKRLADMG